MKNLWIILLLFSCTQIKQETQKETQKQDILNKNIYNSLPHDSLRMEVDGFMEKSFVGKPLEEMLYSLNPNKFKVRNIWYSDKNPQWVIGVVFVSSSNFEFNILFENKNLMNFSDTSKNDSLLSDAYELRHQIVECYEIRYLGIHDLKKLNIDDIQIENWVILRKYL